MDHNKRLWLFGGAGLFLLACCVLVAIGIAVYFLLRGEGHAGLPNSPTENVTVTPAATRTPLPTSTPSGPPPLTLENYQQFGRLQEWEVDADITRVTGIAISHVTNRVALLTERYKEKYSLEVRDMDGKPVWNVPLGWKAVYPAVAFSPDGSLIVTGMDDGTVQMWDAATGDLIETLGEHQYAVRVVAFSPDGSLVASGGSDNRVLLWRVSTGVRIPTCFFWDPLNKSKCRDQNKTDVRDLAFSPDGRYLAVSANVVVVLSTSSGQEIDRFYDQAGDTSDLGEVAFSSDGKTFAASGNWFNTENQRWRKRVLVWTFPTPINQARKIPLTDALEDLVFSADGKLVLGSYKDKGQLLIFDVEERESVGVIDLGPVTLLSYSPDVRLFAILSTRRTVSIWGVIR